MILALLSQLPDVSALAASWRDEPRGWGLDRHLLAGIFDAVQANTWVTANAGAKRKSRKPQRFPRPKSQPKQAAPLVVRVADLVNAEDR